MKSLRNRLLVIAAAALAAICTSAVPASAQAIQGSFTLPNEVRWQGWTFPAGDYTFKMDSVASVQITLKGPDGSAFVHGMVADQSARGEQSSLTIEHRGGTSIVRELYLAKIGLRLRYSVPKAPKEVEVAQEQTERILVAMK